MDERLPEKNQTVKVNNGRELAYIDYSGSWVCAKQFLVIENWLEEKQDQIVLSPQELKQFAMDAYMEMSYRGKSLEQFLKLKE